MSCHAEIPLMLAALGWNPADFTLGKQLSGNTNASYLCQYQEEQYIYRRACTPNAMLSISRAREHQVLTVLRSWPHANHPTYYHHNTGNMLCPLIKGSPISPTEYHSKQHIKNTALLLRELHPYTCSYVFDPFCDIDRWFSIIYRCSFPLCDHLNRLYQHIYLLCNQYHSIDEQFWGLCHNDCYLGNFIYSTDRQLSLIDYEYAAMGDVFFDLACISCNTHTTLSRIEQVYLLENYFGYCNEGLLQKLNDYIFIQLFWNSCLAFVKSLYQPQFTSLATTFLEKAEQYI